MGRLISIGNSRGNPLGLFQVPLLDKQKIELPRGSTLLLYSDGVTEANNEKDEFFGTEGLKSTVPGLLENYAQVIYDQLL
ncbi:MAG: SpoIIE family protein phosphatase [Anaerolineales bacterium]|nr:SpoIIE family protein phosphatase [Anaerolineales bacterium]